MGNNDERTMILNMLKEGKITVDEANALLEVLDENSEEKSGGFAPADEGKDKRREHSPRGLFVHTNIDDESGNSSEGDKKKGFRLDFDFTGLRDSLRDTMKGVSDSLKEAFEGLSDLDLGGEIFRTMGKIRGESEREIIVTTDDASGLKINNKWGDVRVNGTESDEITVHAKITTWSAAGDLAKRAADTMEIKLNRDGDSWALENSLQKTEGVGARVDYEITVPRSISVSASTGSGDLWLEDLDGSQVINTLSGDISIANLGSNPDDSQEMHTNSGDVVAGSLTGNVSVSSHAGDIMINGFRGTLAATTKSGDIQIKEGRGCVKLRTMSGDLGVELAELGDEDTSLSTVSGDVDLHLPENSDITVAAKSTSGDIDSGLGLTVTKSSDHILEGTLGAGTVGVEISTVSGDIGITST